MRKTFLYRAKINNQTKFNCHQWLEICRDIYNSALSQRINIYKKTKKSITKNSQITQLPLIKPDDLIKKIVREQCRRGILQFNKVVITILSESINNKKKKQGVRPQSKEVLTFLLLPPLVGFK